MLKIEVVLRGPFKYRVKSAVVLPESAVVLPESAVVLPESAVVLPTERTLKF